LLAVPPVADGKQQPTLRLSNPSPNRIQFMPII
jgi:hypothetical protein